MEVYRTPAISSPLPFGPYFAGRTETKNRDRPGTLNSGRAKYPLELEADPQTIPGALVLPLEKLEMNPPELPKGREIILYCD